MNFVSSNTEGKRINHFSYRKCEDNSTSHPSNISTVTHFLVSRQPIAHNIHGT